MLRVAFLRGLLGAGERYASFPDLSGNLNERNGFSSRRVSR
jgi:hypothetical protein